MPVRMQSYLSRRVVEKKILRATKEQKVVVAAQPTHAQAQQDTLVVLLTRGKKNGWYVEVGSNHPVDGNNSYVLEKTYGWRGLMVEMDPQFLPLYRQLRPLATHVIGDACRLDYAKLLSGFPAHIDYLQLDLDVENRSTLSVLELLDATVFDRHKFGVVTFEHDIYRGDFFDTRARSREIFAARGYVMLFSDVRVFNLGGWQAFEDWHAHPDVVGSDVVEKVVSHPDNRGGLTHAENIRILQTVSSEKNIP